jgi:hypothetical protein
MGLDDKVKIFRNTMVDRNRICVLFTSLFLRVCGYLASCSLSLSLSLSLFFSVFFR